MSPSIVTIKIRRASSIVESSFRFYEDHAVPGFAGAERYEFERLVFTISKKISGWPWRSRIDNSASCTDNASSGCFASNKPFPTCVIAKLLSPSPSGRPMCLDGDVKAVKRENVVPVPSAGVGSAPSSAAMAWLTPGFLSYASLAGSVLAY